MRGVLATTHGVQLIGLAVLNRHFLDCAFTSAFFKQLLGQPITLGCDARTGHPR